MKKALPFVLVGVAVYTAMKLKEWYFTLVPTGQTGAYTTKGENYVNSILKKPPTVYKDFTNPSYNGTGSYYKPNEYDPLGFYTPNY